MRSDYSPNLLRHSSAISNKTLNTDLFRKLQLLHSADETEIALLRILLSGSAEKNKLGNIRAKRLNHFLIEFCTEYISPRTNREFTPSTMLSYVRGIRRRLQEFGLPVEFSKGSVFDNSGTWLMSVLNDKFAQQQAQSPLTRSRSVLIIKDVRRIFDSEYSNPNKQTGFRNHFIFAVGLAIGARTTKLYFLDVFQFVGRQYV